MSDLLPPSAKEFAYTITRALNGKSVSDRRLANYNVMKEFGWTRKELDETPACDVYSIMFIQDRMAKHNQLHKGMKK